MIEKWLDLKTQLVIDAVQLDPENTTAIADWCHGFEVIEHDAIDLSLNYLGINVPTRDGNKRASQGDYIAKTWFGFDVYKPIRFRMEHSKVED